MLAPGIAMLLVACYADSAQRSSDSGLSCRRGTGHRLSWPIEHASSNRPARQATKKTIARPTSAHVLIHKALLLLDARILLLVRQWPVMPTWDRPSFFVACRARKQQPPRTT